GGRRRRSGLWRRRAPGGAATGREQRGERDAARRREGASDGERRGFGGARHRAHPWLQAANPRAPRRDAASRAAAARALRPRPRRSLRRRAGLASLLEALDALEQGAEVAVAEALVPAALDDLVEERAGADLVVHRRGLAE